MKTNFKIIRGLLLVTIMSFGIIAPSQTSAQTNPNNCSALVRDLTLGATGSDVVALQTFLETKGFMTMPAGVSKGYFGSLTQNALAKYQSSNGINPSAGYFGPVTRGKIISECNSTGQNSNNNSSQNSLKGGDGDIESVKKTTSGTESTLGEGKTEDVLGFDLEADDNSDLKISSIRVKLNVGSDGSNRLNRYLDEVAIMQDGDEVGSISVNKITRKGSEHTATISLKNAIVKRGAEERFYVTLSAKDSINDSDLDNKITVSIDRIRVEDANGAVLNETVSDVSEVVDFEDASANDDARVQNHKNNPVSKILKVDSNKVSDEHNIFTFSIKVDKNSSDLVVTELPITLNIENVSSSTLDINKFIQDIWIEVDGDKYDDYEFNLSSVPANTSTTTVARFSIDEGDLEISEGDTVEAVVYVKFGKQSGNYSIGNKISASVIGSTIVAENTDGDNFQIDGTVNGKQHIVNTSSAEINNFRWDVNNTGTIIDFFFTVSAEDEDFSVLASSIASTTSGTGVVSEGVLTKSTGDADTIVSGLEYKVLEGDKATFRVRYTLSGTNGQFGEVKITSVAGQELPNDKQISPTATRNVQN